MGGRGGAGSGGRNAVSRTLDWAGRLRSANEPGMSVAQEYRQKEVLGNYSENDRDRARLAGFSSPREYQRDITEHIRQHGLINPVRASEGYLDEGYHRYAAMRQLGRKSIPVKIT